MRKICASVAAGAAIALAVAATPALANCYELIGCTDKDYFKPYHLKQLGCQPLWDVRNTIYKENGYCFKTAKAIKYFGNAGCLYDNAADVPLSNVERHNISAITKVERSKGCN
ncbi:YARHG domain-containing protein [Methyloceanibacter sp.]|uniref:YARHG domain-containing protein n=1 Tax=Methyloceanibacter sp. TaxID=1965321 RepID=UPI003D6CFDD0